MKSVTIIGCGGHARSVIDILTDVFIDIKIELYDENALENEYIFEEFNGGYCVCPLTDNTILSNRHVFIAVGDNRKRKEWVHMFNGGNNMISIVSPRAYVSKFSKIGVGNFIADATHIGPSSRIGNYCIINSCSVVEHEVIIGDFTHVSVNSTVCGRCKIGNNVFIGAGAVVKDKISICDDVIVGANAVVVKDIIQPGVYVGNPVSVLK